MTTQPRSIAAFLPRRGDPHGRHTVITLLALFVSAVALFMFDALIHQARADTASAIDVVDVAGRSVSVPQGAQRIILGEGRMMYSIAVLDREDPFQRIVGWKDDLIKYDPDTFRRFEQAFPEQVARIENFGSPYSGDFSIETAIDLDTDLVILDLGNLFKAEESGVIATLDKAGIPVIFIDFRKRPTQNTVPSLQLLGKALDREDEAAEFIDFYRAQMSRVTNVVDTLAADEKPLVFIENAAGYNPGFCCTTYGSANFGQMVEDAGGINWGSGQFTGYTSEVSFEAILDDDPDIIIGTGANWAEDKPEATAVPLGYEARPDVVSRTLSALAERPGFKDMRAVEQGNFHSIYHQFYNSPWRVVALQVFATWLHPDEFPDLDPEATFRTLHERFLPFDYEGQFWATREAAN